MARADYTKLKAIIDTKRGEEEITPMINLANSLVNELLLDEGYSTDLLAQIELWLAAHFVAVRDPKTSSHTIDGITYQTHGQTGMKGLEHTPYGTQVMMLEHHGVLQRAAKSKGKVDFEALP